MWWACEIWNRNRPALLGAIVSISTMTKTWQTHSADKSKLCTSMPSISINDLTRYCWRWPMLRGKVLHSRRMSLNYTQWQRHKGIRLKLTDGHLIYIYIYLLHVADIIYTKGASTWCSPRAALGPFFFRHVRLHLYVAYYGAAWTNLSVCLLHIPLPVGHFFFDVGLLWHCL